MVGEDGARSAVKTNEKVATDHADLLDGEDDTPLPVSGLVSGKWGLAFVVSREAAVVVVAVGANRMECSASDGRGLLPLVGDGEQTTLGNDPLHSGASDEGFDSS